MKSTETNGYKVVLDKNRDKVTLNCTKPIKQWQLNVENVAQKASIKIVQQDKTVKRFKKGENFSGKYSDRKRRNKWDRLERMEHHNSNLTVIVTYEIQKRKHPRLCIDKNVHQSHFNKLTSQ